MNSNIYFHLDNLKERVHGSSNWAKLDFSINTNPLGPPDSIIQLLQQSDLSWITKYPDVNAVLLKERLADELGILKEQIVVGNGAAELFFLLPRVLKVNRGIVIQPTFGEYEPSLLAANIPVKRLYYHLDQDRFTFPLSELNAVLQAGDLIYLCRPNNPTGQMVPLGEIHEILTLVEKRKAFLLVDESFIDFTDEPEGLLYYFRENKPIILVRSLTKFYTIPGIRLGYLIGSDWLINSIELARDPWSVNALSQKIGQLILDEILFYQKTREWINKERDWFYQQMKEFATFNIYPSSANYHLIRSVNSETKNLYNYLKTKGIAIRMADSFPGLGDQFFRLAIKNREDNQRLIEELKFFVSAN